MVPCRFTKKNIFKINNNFFLKILFFHGAISFVLQRPPPQSSRAPHRSSRSYRLLLSAHYLPHYI